LWCATAHLTIPLSFLTVGATYEAVIYRNAHNADWDNNSESYVVEKKLVTSKDALTVYLAKGSGYAILFVKKWVE
jgi:hypothetical protein